MYSPVFFLKIISVVYSHVIVFVFINSFSIRHWTKVTKMSCSAGGVCDVLPALGAPICLCIPIPLLYIALPATSFICFLYLFIHVLRQCHCVVVAVSAFGA